MKSKTLFIGIVLVIFSSFYETAECRRNLNPPKNGMLVMNKAKTVAMAFCPIGSFLFKDDKPLIFPMRYVYKNEEWNPEPVDPSGGGLVPIPDCIPIEANVEVPSTFEIIAEFFQFDGRCKSKEIQENMKRRMRLAGVCEGACEDALTANCG